jgi:GNAT superfamily N-acetyltransferase
MKESTEYAIVSPDELEQNDSWIEILRKTMPEEEMEPTEVIVKGVRDRTGHAIGAHVRGAPAGLATVALLREPPVGFLVCIAADPKMHNQGIGTALFQKAYQETLKSLSAEGRDPQGLVWEVDDIDAKELTPAEYERRRRRIAFFQKQGGILLDRRYVQPPLMEGGNPVPMRLMIRPEGTWTLTPEKINEIIRAMHWEKYGAINGIRDEVLLRMAELMKER